MLCTVQPNRPAQRRTRWRSPQGAEENAGQGDLGLRQRGACHLPNLPRRKPHDVPRRRDDRAAPEPRGRLRVPKAYHLTPTPRAIAETSSSRPARFTGASTSHGGVDLTTQNHGSHRDSRHGYKRSLRTFSLVAPVYDLALHPREAQAFMVRSALDADAIHNIQGHEEAMTAAMINTARLIALAMHIATNASGGGHHRPRSQGVKPKVQS